MRRFDIVRALLLILLAAVPLTAQSPAATGRIVGRVVDATSGAPIADAGVHIVGTALGSRTGVDGRYTIGAVSAGMVAIQVRRIGFAAKTVAGVVVSAGETAEQDVALGTTTVQLEAQVVTASSERGTVSSALDAQRSAVGVVNSVTAEQISRSPDGDAAQAVKRVSGVTVQDGKYVFVRGLGERYTTSALNGARVPSPEPERRVVPLDMFPAGLLQSITTAKTFTPDLQGDFSGAFVDIRTREYPSQRTSMLQLGSGYEMGATGAPLVAPSAAGGERFANVGRSRALPALVQQVGDIQNLSLTQSDVNRLVGSFRNAWTPQASTGAPLLNGSASIGGNDDFLLGHKVGYLLSGTFASGMDLKEGQLRSLADRGNSPGETVEIDRFTGQTASQSSLWGGLANVSTLLGQSSRISFNGLYNRSGENSARVENGLFTADALKARITRMQYVERGLFSGQLAGEHQFGASQHLEWNATTSGVRRYEPDRTAFVQVYERDSDTGPEVLRWLSGGSGGAVRTFSDLRENSHEYSGKYSVTVPYAGIIRVGGLFRATSRDAQSLSYAFSANGATNAQRELPLEQIFDGRFTAPGSTLFTFAPLAQGGSYTAEDRLRAAFAMLETSVGTRLRVVGGARLESDRLQVNAHSTLGSPVSTTKRWDDVLPSLALTWQLTGTQQLRMSATRTLARPEYRELSPIISRDVVGGENVQGDEHLESTNVSTLDLRWEQYPSDGELFSVALFAKHFVNPVERVFGSGSGGTSFVFFTNAASADNLGVEVELRRNLGALASVLSPLSVFGNVTVMRSQIHLSEGTLAAATNLNRAMVGQAPYVINTGATYSTSDSRTSATLLFNRVGARLAAAGGSPLPDVVDLPRNVMDVSMRYSVSSSVVLRSDLKNLLDAPYQTVQGTVVRDYYRAGRTVTLGAQWRP